MIPSGLQLMAIGMGFVFAYLVLMILATNISKKLLQKVTLREEQEFEAEKSAKSKKPGGGSNAKLVAVISSAVNEHRSN